MDMDKVSALAREGDGRRGFTLVELLVVIAIISLLLSILTPLLRRANDLAKAVACRSNERQLNLAFVQYTNANRGRGFGRVHNFDDFWMGLLGRYTGDLDSIRVCPVATVERRDYGYGSAELAWSGAAWPGSWITKGNDYHWGSFGFNDWLYDSDARSDSGYEGDYANYMRVRSTMPRPDRVPVFYDSTWCSANPSETDDPGDLEDPYGAGPIFIMMARLCIDRHDMAINISFLDGGTRLVPLHELWSRQWHRNWNYALASTHALKE